MASRKDVDSITDLISLAGLFPGSDDAIVDLYQQIGPEPPEELKETRVGSTVAGAVLKFNYDEGHAGRYSVPNTQGGSISATNVMKQEAFGDYINQFLTFRDIVAEEKDSELTIFIPGLNTFHEPHPGETTTVDRMEHYVKVLGCLPMAQIHIGTSADQGDVRIDASASRSLSLLSNRVSDDLKPRYEGNEMVWDERQIDRLQGALSKTNRIDTPVKQSVRLLLESSSVPNAPSVVIVGYSRGSMELEAVLRQYIDSCTKAGETLEDVEQRLREKVTIVTVGSATAEFPDGPAYVHVASWKDPVATTAGVTATHNVNGAGRDALFLNCGTPYNSAAFDNHNFGAVTAQYVSTTLFLNEVTGFRALWEKSMQGAIKQPRDSMVNAVIQLTRGYEWLWDSGAAWKDIPYGALPSDKDAEASLRRNIGDAYVDRILANFPR